ncbi:alcohol dehydrogenase catalytic domain-containing protein, partial [Bifidobacterium longum]
MSDMMKAAIFVEPGKMAVEEVPKATLEQDDDIVIRVVRTCVCGSDLWFFRGLSGQAAHSQVGHESIGVVEETGAAVESVKPGDFVVVPFP